LNTCPKCNSDNIDHYDTSFEEFDELEQFVECLDCKFKWTELFKCVKWYPDRGTEVYSDDDREYEPNEKYDQDQATVYCDRCKIDVIQDKFVEHCKEHKDQFINTQDDTQVTKGHVAGNNLTNGLLSD